VPLSLPKRPSETKRLLVELGWIVFTLGCEPLQKALRQVIGEDWRNRYREARENSIGRNERITDGKFEHRLVVADLAGKGNLAVELKKEGLEADVYQSLGGSGPSTDQRKIVVGNKVPVELAVAAIRIARRVWPFLNCVILTSETGDIPEFVHNSVFFGGRARRLLAWTADDFNGLEPSMSPEEFHAYVKARLKSRI
jgi:hypothetical protein